ncbi:GAF domain-containing protein [Novipirellula sp. SH528]|uniref:GAF domain-containing protein n=1 Tax=Novipirellula sp. SH528 TaxID=3454466 RepID=UPI003F9F1FA1
MGIDVAESSALDCVFGLTSRIVNGATLDETLNFVFESFSGLIPYDRIGFAEIDELAEYATARWLRSNESTHLRLGYSAALASSSLSVVLKLRQPRILNNLNEYLERRPNSRSTRLMIREGMQSSLTCPVIANEQPHGFLFFSSKAIDSYTKTHIKLSQVVAIQLAMQQLETQRIAATKKRASKSPPADELAEAALSEPDRGPRHLSLSQLEPGMVLADPIQLGNGQLLLASKVVLSEVSIERLIRLAVRGFLRVESVCVL